MKHDWAVGLQGAAEVGIRERIRVAALYSYGVLDTGPEVEFDIFVLEAAQLFQAPMATISLIDVDRQWFKARKGVDVGETERRISFCTHAIEGDSIFFVADASQDPRFADNPLVTGPPFIRFYAGAPLKTPLGRRIGTINVMDDHPRTGVTERQREWLIDAAARIMQKLEVRRAALVRSRALAHPDG
jgi:GAF domain-containing protein